MVVCTILPDALAGGAPIGGVHNPARCAGSTPAGHGVVKTDVSYNINLKTRFLVSPHDEDWIHQPNPASLPDFQIMKDQRTATERSAAKRLRQKQRTGSPWCWPKAARPAPGPRQGQLPAPPDSRPVHALEAPDQHHPERGLGWAQHHGRHGCGAGGPLKREALPFAALEPAKCPVTTCV